MASSNCPARPSNANENHTTTDGTKPKTAASAITGPEFLPTVDETPTTQHVKSHLLLLSSSLEVYSQHGSWALRSSRSLSISLGGATCGSRSCSRCRIINAVLDWESFILTGGHSLLCIGGWGETVSRWAKTSAVHTNLNNWNKSGDMSYISEAEPFNGSERLLTSQPSAVFQLLELQGCFLWWPRNKAAGGTRSTKLLDQKEISEYSNERYLGQNIQSKRVHPDRQIGEVPRSTIGALRISDRWIWLMDFLMGIWVQKFSFRCLKQHEWFVLVAFRISHLTGTVPPPSISLRGFSFTPLAWRSD